MYIHMHVMSDPRERIEVAESTCVDMQVCTCSGVRRREVGVQGEVPPLNVLLH